MELSLEVTLAVLAAALLHASWNALIKSGREPLLDTALVAFGGTLIALPFALVVPPPEPAAWPYLLGTVTVHVGYYLTMAAAYRAGDLSLAYPVMRGVAPLLVAAVGVFWLGERLAPAAWAGVLLICAGVLSLAFVGGRGAGSSAGNRRAATLWALACAAIIATYTLIDGAGVRVAGGVERYLVWLWLFLGLPFGLGVLAVKRGVLIAHARRYWVRGLAGAALSGLAYSIALWAMTRAPVAIVAALRETSVIFAALIGAWFLREGHLRERLAGAAVVLAGLAALKL